MCNFIWFYIKLDFKVGWKKLKEVFSIAGTVKRADIKEDKDGKSRGMGTVTFEQAIEAVQAICILIYTWALFNKVEVWYHFVGIMEFKVALLRNVY